jgi:hypothetical protein
MSLLDAPLARIAAAVRAEPGLGPQLAAEARRRIAARPELGAVVELVPPADASGAGAVFGADGVRGRWPMPGRWVTRRSCGGSGAPVR